MKGPIQLLSELPILRKHAAAPDRKGYAMKRTDPEELGKPNLEFACLQIWIWGRQFEDSHDYWDGNWLRVAVHCGSAASDVWAEGAILHISELAQWSSDLRDLNRTVEGTAELLCTEPNLGARVVLDKMGRGTLRVQLAQNYEEEHHEVTTRIDQSYLPRVISDLSRILAEYPLRGQRPSEAAR
jgi:hypothetical protein